jgi:hypothetical protein
MSHGHNAEFLKDPKAYLGNITIHNVTSGFKGFKPEEPQARIYMDLVAISTGGAGKAARVDFSNTPIGDAPIEGGWIPYISEGLIGSDHSKLPFLELPAGGSPRFVFTGAMNGCSLVMASKGGKNWGIHQPNSKAATQAFPLLVAAGFTYVKSVDFYQLGQLAQGSYGTQVGVDRTAASRAAGNDTGWFNTFAFFLYTGGVWRIIAQPQFAWFEGSTYKARSNGAILEV